MRFARYETPMVAGFRKYALLYRKAARIRSRDSADETRSAAYWQLAVADSFTPRPTPAGFHLDLGLPLTARRH